MPDDGNGEKTEEATPRKLNKAREEGQVAMSTEVNTAVLLVAGFAALAVLGPGLYQAFAAAMRFALSDALHFELDDANTMHLLIAQQAPVMMATAGILALAFLVAIIVTSSQVGLKFTLKPLMPKASRISPLSGFKRLFGMRGLMRTTINVFKLVAIVSVAWVLLWFDVLPLLKHSLDIEQLFHAGAWALFRLAMALALVLGLIATLDFLYQKWQFQKDQKMSKQEVKDEMKQSEGDPLVKGRIRQIQRQMAQQRMMQEVPKADVVITNPTHVAVALRYDRHEMDAPVVVAKGYDLVAQRIKAIASEHDIIQVENVPLARALAKEVEVGQFVPPEFFQAVAEVLGHVYRLQGKRA